MTTITSTVREIIQIDEVAESALRHNILNFSSYARKIQSRVEAIMLKPVNIRSIIVALTRISKETLPPENEHDLKILNLSIYSSLEEVTYERSSKSLDLVRDVYSNFQKMNKKTPYFVITESLGQVTIIGETEIIQSIKKAFKNAKPYYEVSNLVGLTIKFPLEYLDTPNVIYGFMKKLAAKKINIIEVVSTTTELTFIIETKNLDKAVGQLTKSL